MLGNTQVQGYLRPKLGGQPLHQGAVRAAAEPLGLALV